MGKPGTATKEDCGLRLKGFVRIESVKILVLVQSQTVSLCGRKWYCAWRKLRTGTAKGLHVRIERHLGEMRMRSPELLYSGSENQV